MPAYTKKRISSYSPSYYMGPPQKKRKLQQAEKKIVEAEVAVANAMEWDSNWGPSRNYNAPIPSGTPSGLYNLSTQTKEYKFVDSSFGTTSAPVSVTSGAVAGMQLLNGLKLGTSAFQRIGNKIAMKSLYWSLAFGLSAVDSDPTVDVAVLNVPVRMMVVYDKQTNGALPVGSDLLTNVTGVDNTTARAIDVNSPNNLNNKDRFVVVADKRFILSSNGSSARHIKKYKRLNTSVSYKSGATVGNVTDITSGGLYLYFFADADLATATDPAPSVWITGDVRLRYQDD